MSLVGEKMTEENKQLVEQEKQVTNSEPIEETKYLQTETQNEQEDIVEKADIPAPEKQTQEKKYYYDYDFKESANQEHKDNKAEEMLKKGALFVLGAIIFGAVAGLTFAGTTNINKPKDNATATHESIGSTDLVIGNSQAVVTDVTNVVKNVMPSVVSITSLSVQEVDSFFFGTQTYENESTGSGIIIGQNDKELLLVTNNHVIENSTNLTVSFIDEESVKAVVKSKDASLDLAVIAVNLSDIKAETMNQIKVATIGDSSKLQVGEPAIAIGNALGYGQSVTSGIISAVERELDGFDTKLIQTDAAINPGNSGGALLNIKGEVIGINTVKVSADAVESMGYAIPISDVQEIIKTMMNKATREKVDEKERGTIGISAVTVDENATKLYGIPAGVFVDSVLEDSGAQKANMPKNCVITKVNDITVKTMDDLQEELSYYKAGETVKLTIQVQSDGGYVEKTLDVELQSVEKTESSNPVGSEE